MAITASSPPCVKFRSSITYVNPQTGERIILPIIPSIQSANRHTEARQCAFPKRRVPQYKVSIYLLTPNILKSTRRLMQRLPGTYQTPGPEEGYQYNASLSRHHLSANNCTSPEFERTMFGAYVLFPYHNEEEYQQHKFYAALER